MNPVNLALVILVAAMLVAVVRMIRGPSGGDRATAADMVFFSFVAVVAMLGLRFDSDVVLDVVLVATIVGFIATLATARLLTGGKR